MGSIGSITIGNAGIVIPVTAFYYPDPVTRTRR